MNRNEKQRERREIYLRRGERISDLVREGFIRFTVHRGGKLDSKVLRQSTIPGPTGVVDEAKR